MVALADLQVPVTEADEVRRVTAEVLARPELADLQPTWLDRLWSALAEGVGRLLELLAAGDQATLVGAVVLVGVAAAVLFAVWRLVRGVRRGARATEAVVELGGRTGGDWQRQAAEHERSSRWREALRCHYRALVADLAGAGLVEEIPGRTAREYLAAVSTDAPAAAGDFARATQAFEAAWYGDAPVGAAEVQQMRSAADGVRKASALRSGLTGAGA